MNGITFFPTCTKTAPKLFQLMKLWVIKRTCQLDKGLPGWGKSRRKQDFSPLYHLYAFFFMGGNLKTMLPCITQIHLLLCSRLQAVARESPKGTKSTTFQLGFFSGYFFFFTIPNRQNMFFPHELQQVCINSTCK